MRSKIQPAGKVSEFLKESRKKRVLVSACLMGWECRYDGGNCHSPLLFDYTEKYGWSLVPVCPEVLGGLKIPRSPAAISGGSAIDVWNGGAAVVDTSLRNVTKFFIEGAKKALWVAERTGCDFAVMKEVSPSCGVNAVKNPSGERIEGRGVTSHLLLTNGIKIISEEELILFHGVKHRGDTT